MRAARVHTIILAMIAIWAAVPAASALERQSVHRDWQVFRTTGADGPVCFAQTRAVQSLPRAHQHGEVFLSVASWRSGAARRQVQLSTSTPLRLAAPTRAWVGRSAYKMFAEGRDAFVDQMREEASLIGSMRRGSDMMVTTFADNGDKLTYEFSLLGVTAAINEVDRLCG